VAFDQLAAVTEFPILDEQILAQLAADTTPDLPRKLVEMFLAELNQRVEDLSTLQAVSDLPALGEAAHRLKGSAGTLGASRLQQIALVLEKAGKRGDETQAKQGLDALKPVVEETQDVLQLWLTKVRA
jgi:HPt (histidine-containing phosphotransfer) domain-containing protein